jgi:hypothetical protein
MRLDSIDLAVLHFEICDLIARYSHSLDDGDVDTAVSLFVEDGVFDAAIGGCMTGQAALTAYYSAQQVAPEWRPYRGGQHLNTNTVIHSYGSGDVTAITDFIYVVPTEKSQAIKFLGRYKDVIRQLDGEWKFVRREVTANPCAPT